MLGLLSFADHGESGCREPSVSFEVLFFGLGFLRLMGRHVMALIEQWTVGVRFGNSDLPAHRKRSMTGSFLP